jgi:hypothetical protein
LLAERLELTVTALYFAYDSQGRKLAGIVWTIAAIGYCLYGSNRVLEPGVRLLEQSCES